MNKPVVGPTFEDGQFVIHVDAGVGKIEEIVTETILGTEVECYLVVCKRVRVRVPVANAHNKLQLLPHQSAWNDAKTILNSKPKNLPSKSSRLTTTCLKRLRLGTVVALCELLRDTVQRKTVEGELGREISLTQRGVFNTVWTHLVDLYTEMHHVERTTAETALRGMCPASFVIPESAYGQRNFVVPASGKGRRKIVESVLESVKSNSAPVTATASANPSAPEAWPKKAKEPAKAERSYSGVKRSTSTAPKATAPASARVGDRKKVSAKKATPSSSSTEANKMKKLEAENRALAAQVAQLQAEKKSQVETAEWEKVQLVERLTGHRNQIGQLNHRVSQREQEISNLRREIQKLQRELKQVSARPANLAEFSPLEDLSLQRVLELEEQNRQLRGELRVCRTQVTKLKKARKKLEGEVMTACKIKRQIQQVRRELFAYMKERTGRVEQLEALLREERAKRK